MKRKEVPADPVVLRRKAEARLTERGPKTLPVVAEGELRRIVHELEVHQVELELRGEELERARLECESAAERYGALFEFAPIGYAIIGADEKIVEINHAGARILGTVKAKLVGAQLMSFVLPAHRFAFSALVGKALLAESATIAAEVEIMRPNATPIDVKLTATSMVRQEPQILLALEDVTERKWREQRLVKSEMELRAAGRRKDEFLAMLSHELRNPLAAIKNSIFVMQNDAATADQTARARSTIERQTAHLARLVDDIIDVTRIQHGKIELRREAVELGALVTRAMEDHATLFESRGIVVRRSLEPTPLWVFADSARMLQVAGNLLTNAAKFTPAGRTVKVATEHQGSFAVLRVTDDGSGIERDVLPHVFEPFTQGRQESDRASGGLGLGLPMVKEIVELHQGQVAIASEGPGHGTEVTVSIPIHMPTEAEQRVSEPGPTRRRAAPRRVLVIEDNASAAESLNDALTCLGHEVMVAGDGMRGLEVARRWDPQVVICDIGLPGMDGYDVARALRAEHSLSGVVLVALSGYAQKSDVERAAHAGFDHHVAKPPSLAELERLFELHPESSGAHNVL